MVVAALNTYASTGSAVAALAALSRSRVLVPVLAVPDDPANGSYVEERSTQMATVLSVGRDGRTALLAFSCMSTLVGWQADARPVPQPTARAAHAACGEGAAALLIDIAGPVPLAIEGEDLEHLAAGLVLLPTATGYAWALPTVLRPGAVEVPRPEADWYPSH